MNLSPNERKVYEYVLAYGPCTTGPIIKDTQIANSQVYRILGALIKKGAVSYAVHKNGKRFRASDPDIFLEKAKEEFETAKEWVEELRKKQSIPEDTQSAVYEGFDGFKTAFRRIIEETPHGGTIRIIGFSSDQPALKSLRIFLKNQNLRCAEKKQKLKIILGNSSRKNLGSDREGEAFSEVRYLPDEFISPAAVDITEDAVYTFLWDHEPYVSMTRNKRIAKSYQQYFDMLWKQAKRR